MTRPIDRAPKALLLDFGGVIFQTTKRDTGRDEFVAECAERIERGGWSVPAADIRSAIDAGLAALKHWKHASSRRLEPRELTHREIVGDFLAASLDPPVRALLVAEADDVLASMNRLLSDHAVRPGITDVIRVAGERGVPLGIVSNAHSGRSHRQILAEHGLERAFAVQVYSDEVGIRKPHPRMLTLAATALGVDIADTWYVGDTQDRDLVAGRRAGVGAVVLTTSQHTDTPPFEVSDEADATFPTPEGLAEALAAATSSAAPATPPTSRPALPTEPVGRAAVFIDHGGVISRSERDEEQRTVFAEHLARLLDHPSEPCSTDDARAIIDIGRAHHQERKARLATVEITPIEYWRDLVGQGLGARARALLEAEAADLMYRWGRTKSRRHLRPGMRELLEHCAAHGTPVVVVSNTVSGRAVRAECAAHGIDHLIAAFVCSDENGHRKPDPRILEEAIFIAGADPAQSVFLGDKPHTDGRVSLELDIARRVIVRDGSTSDADIAAALDAGTITHIVDDPSGVIDLLAADDGSILDDSAAEDLRPTPEGVTA